MDLLISCALAGLVLALVSLREAYGHLSIKELKRRSQEDNQIAKQLHKAAVYGPSLRVILWLLQAVLTAVTFGYIAAHFSPTGALIAGVGLVLAAYAWLPAYGPTGPGVWLAANLAPVFGFVMQYIHSPIAWTRVRLSRYWPRHRHSGVFDKDDLLELIQHQDRQPDNRINSVELELIANALEFGDKLVSQHMTPRRKAKSVGIGDSIGPILMDELHASGQTRFPVYDGKKSNLVGTLFLRDLVNTKASAVVRDVMRPRVCYIHEDQTLQDALQAILRTHHHLLTVVNDDQSYVGVISIEDVLGQVIGDEVVDEFDQYDDKQAVVRRGAKPQPAPEPEEPDEPEPTPSEEPTEVIE